MTIHPRTRLLGAAAAAAVVTLIVAGTAAYAGSGHGPRLTLASATPSAPPTVPPVESPSPLPTVPPSLSPSPIPSVTSSPDPTCSAEPIAGLTANRVVALEAGPVTCEDIHSIITVSWDGTNIKVVIKPADFAEGTCTLDTKSVKATAPANAKVNDDGSVEVPYDKTKAVKITITIEYDLTCKLGDLTITLKKVATIEFTPPDGPVSIKNKNRAG